jgi:hypothetical protein
MSDVLSELLRRGWGVTCWSNTEPVGAIIFLRWRNALCPSGIGLESASKLLEDMMDLILVLLIVFLVFGGGGYWGYRRCR